MNATLTLFKKDRGKMINTCFNLDSNISLVTYDFHTYMVAISLAEERLNKIFHTRVCFHFYINR